jgi:hypothetical protein
VVGADRRPGVEGSAARHALTEAMACGVGCLRFAEASIDAARQRDDIVGAAKIAMGAISNGDLVLAYQPVVSATGRNQAAFHECLVRVRERSGNLIAAAKFMPAMEQLGLATLIDRQVLVLALDALAHRPGIRISINIFPQTMQDAQWMILFNEGTSRDPTLAERLIIEVTETAAMLEPARTLEFMARLRRHGCLRPRRFRHGPYLVRQPARLPLRHHQDRRQFHHRCHDQRGQPLLRRQTGRNRPSFRHDDGGRIRPGPGRRTDSAR